MYTCICFSPSENTIWQMKVSHIVLFILAVVVQCCRGGTLALRNAQPLDSAQHCVCVAQHLCGNHDTTPESQTVGNKISPNACSSSEVCCNPHNVLCGQRPLEDLVTSLTPFREGQSLYGEFPWMVAILGSQYVNKNYQTAAYYCGGSLIRLNVVLTAAHCVKGKKNLSVRVGEWSVSSQEPHPIQERNVRYMVLHKSYSSQEMHNDIALLFLESPVEPAPNVATVCLPEQGEAMNNLTCAASGWGKDVFGEVGKYQDTLKKVTMSTVSNGLCQEKLHTTILGRQFKLHDSVLCAVGHQGRDMCKGDGGSPMVCPSAHNPNIYRQAGIVSWGIGCGGEIPAGYVNVAHFRKWIDRKIAMSLLLLKS